MITSVWLDEILGAVALCALALSIAFRARGKREDSVFAVWFAVATAVILIARNW